MKKSYARDKNDAASLREALGPLDERCPLPNSLKAQRILQNAGKPRRRYAAPPRPRLSLTVLVLAVVTAVLFGQAIPSTFGPYRAAPTEAATDATDFGTSYYELEQAFLRLQKQERENNNLRAREKRAAGGIDLFGLFGGRFDGAIMVEDAEAALPSPPATDPGEFQYASVLQTREHGDTNTQVRGVDEADILKNDGEHLYYIQGGRLYILRTLPDMRALSSMNIPNYRQNAELYLQGNRMALVYSEFPPGGDPASSVQVYDIADRENPLLVKSFSQQGSLLSSRMIDGRVYLLSTQGANLDFTARDGKITPEDILPVVYEDSRPRTLPAGCIAIMPEAEEPGYLLVSSLDIESNRSESESAAILGAGSQVYCSTSALFVAFQQHQNAGVWARGFGLGNKTTIYKFDLLPGGKIKAGGTGEVPGAPLNQFSMDEYRGYFRIATTGNRESDFATVNFITVLDGNLKQVGSLENIAPGERIQSARFLGGTGYIVTFRQTDPLFVVGLEDPTAPKILGELKLPGFSAYLHPWDEKHLIGIGPGGDDRGTDGSTKVSLFDISDPARPTEADKVIIPNTWSDIQQNHKILSVCAEKGLFGLPLRDQYGRSDFYTFLAQGDRITRSWTLGPAGTPDAREAPYYGYYYGDYDLRGTYVDNTWYVLGTRGVAAYAMDSGITTGSLMF